MKTSSTAFKAVLGAKNPSRQRFINLTSMNNTKRLAQNGDACEQQVSQDEKKVFSRVKTVNPKELVRKLNLQLPSLSRDTDDDDDSATEPGDPGLAFRVNERVRIAGLRYALSIMHPVYGAEDPAKAATAAAEESVSTGDKAAKKDEKLTKLDVRRRKADKSKGEAKDPKEGKDKDRKKTERTPKSRVPAVLKDPRKTTLPPFTVIDFTRELNACEDLIAVNEEQRIYLKPARKVLGYTIPAVVSQYRFPRFFPSTFAFTYNIILRKINGCVRPYVHVERERYHFSRLVGTYSFEIEHELFLQCFNQSSVRDYDTLINSIFMVVNRGNDGVKISWDVNAKIEAIAALYLARNADWMPASSLLNTIYQYLPKVEGFYALGDVNTPQTIDYHFNVHWKEPRKPVEQHYVMRLLDDAYANIIKPLYAPARTKAELEKGFSKRLTPPPRDYESAADFPGYGSRRETNKHLRDAVTYVIQHVIMPFARNVSDLSPEQIMAECKDHARKRFTQQKEINAYVEGARIAIEEGEDSELFKKCLNGATDLETFDKKEPYDKSKPIRYIMAPSIKVRGFCHALLLNAQHRLFPEGDNRNPYSVKHMSDSERAAYVKELFGTCEVFNTDYSSMEASVSADMMEIIEMPVFMLLTPQCMRKKVGLLWDRYISRNYHIRSKEFDLTIPPMRLSGQDHTSAGNWLLNVTWLFYAIKMQTGYYPKLSGEGSFRFVCEGDDGLGTMDFLLDADKPTKVRFKPETATIAAKTLGASLKCDVFRSYNDASFCGLHLQPGCVNGFPVEDLFLDTYYVLAKVLWDVGYDRSTKKHDSCKLYARCLSYLPRCVANRDLYRALYYLATKHQPSNDQVRTNWFRKIWIQTFYKGDIAEVELKDWQLEKYVKAHNLPEILEITEPEILRTPGPDVSSMQVVYVEKPAPVDPIKLCLEDYWLLANRTGRPDEGYSVLLNPKDGYCAYDSLWWFLHETSQIDDGLTMKAFRIVGEHLHHAKAITDSQMLQLLPEGGYVYVKRDFGPINRCWKEGGEIHEEILAEKPDFYVQLDSGDMYSFFVGHAYVMGKRAPKSTVFGDGHAFLALAVASAILIICVCVFAVAMFSKTFYGLSVGFLVCLLRGVIGYWAPAAFKTQLGNAMIGVGGLLVIDRIFIALLIFMVVCFLLFMYDVSFSDVIMMIASILAFVTVRLPVLIGKALAQLLPDRSKEDMLTGFVVIAWNSALLGLGVHLLF